VSQLFASPNVYEASEEKQKPAKRQKS